MVTDFSPLREHRSWKEQISKKLDASVSIHEVDTHNIVPVWVASDKLEYGARTIRSKINKLLPEYLIDFPALNPPKRKWPTPHQSIEWGKLITDVARYGAPSPLNECFFYKFEAVNFCISDSFIRKGAEVPELLWCEPGEDAAMEVLKGSKSGFLTTRLKNYSTDRNDPLKPKALSCLSPYLHFGQISAQRCALEAHNVRKLYPQVSLNLFLFWFNCMFRSVP